MREVLFRGKTIFNNRWVQGDFLSPAFEKIPWILPTGECEEVKVDPETVGQYTGLTDKNGKKIFEGDIVKHYNNSDDVFDIGALYWDKTFSQWKRTSIGNFHHSSFTYVMSRSCEYEVIGNIHDNPELLKGAENNV